MKNPVVDITNCEREPIHIPGNIQSHGFLIAIDIRDATVCYASENIADKTGVSAARILGQSFAWFLTESGIHLQNASVAQLVAYNSASNFDAINPISVQIGNTPYCLILHMSGSHILLAEFEPCQLSIETELNRLVGVSLSLILDEKTVKGVLQKTAQQVRQIIQYDRVMIYKFWEDGHGEVIAEDKSEELEPFFGLHYPASDIPRQARDLYLANLTRIITDVLADTSALLAHNSGGAAPAPLDLTHSTLRAVSPVHIQYLKNMDVASSFSVSIVSHNKLWGLIACHNATPKFIDYKAREAAKLLGQILSSSVDFRYEEENKDVVRGYRLAAEQLVLKLQSAPSIAQAFERNKQLVLPITNASGAAILYDGKIYTVGTTPSPDKIKGIANWLKQSVTEPLFHTDRLSLLYAPAAEYAEVASGLLASMLSKEMDEYILWFKPELVKTVNWAGNPEKPVEYTATGETRLTPRHSFATWSQLVKQTSEPWSSPEIAAVTKLREDITYVISQIVNHIRQLNARLNEAYEELDTFSFTISHDLKSPITSIRNYTELILEEHPDLDADAVRMLNRILKSTDKMAVLIKEVLSYSRLSRKELTYEDIDMSLLIHEIVTEQLIVYKNSKVKIVYKDLLNLKADKTMMMQVFTNVIGNAIKYSQHSENPVVTIESSEQGDDILYRISDNGIGIDMSFGNQVFEIFKRLDNVAQYEGSGVGLSIVKRILEKHCARIWYESKVKKGTTFYLLFTNNKV